MLPLNARVTLWNLFAVALGLTYRNLAIRYHYSYLFNNTPEEGTVMKILRWSLLSIALAFLIVPIGSVPVYASERGTAISELDMPSISGPVEGPSNGSPKKIKPEHVDYVQDPFGLQYAISFLAALTAVGIIIGIIWGLIQIGSWIGARAAKWTFRFLRKYEDSKVVSILYGLKDDYFPDVMARCDDKNDGSKSYVNEDNGIVECRKNGVIVWTEDADTWIRAHY